MARGPFVNDNPTDVTIWAIRADGTGLRQITHPTGFQQSFDDSPQWSPDSKRIVFQRNQAPLFKTEVWTADSTTGGGLVRVSPPGVNGGDHPDYSPDGQWIMFRTDNGVPFASAQALFGLSKLSVWWLRLGIAIERIKPGHPQQNGRHERMHLTLKKEATKPAAQNMLQQQERFDDFIDCYNYERPHQALDMRYPAELYVESPRPYRGLGELAYPLHDRTVTVTNCGRVCFGKRKINLSTVFAGQNVGVKQVDERIWLVTFMQYDLGFFDDETCRLEPAENPFQAKVLPMSPV